MNPLGGLVKLALAAVLAWAWLTPSRRTGRSQLQTLIDELVGAIAGTRAPAA